MKVRINGIDYEALRDFTITEQLGNKTISTIKVLVEDQPVPLAGDVIELIGDNNEVIFWGTCGIPKSPKFSTGHETQIYEISCNNANNILANRIINVAYQSTSLSDIVTDIFNGYISAENITLGYISTIPIVLEVYTAPDFNLQNALNELADLVGAIWKIDNDHKFYFIAEEDFPKFPHAIDHDFLLGTEMQERTKDYQTRTVQYISGATDNTSQQTEQFVYDGDQNSFITVFPISKRPAISINGTPVPDAKIGINGIDDGEDIIFSFSFNSTQVTIKDKDALTAGDSVVIAYYGIFPIRVVVRNEEKISEIASLTGTSGMREKVYIANDVTTTADAYALANSLLSQFSQASKEVKFWLLSSQLEALGLDLSDTEILTQIKIDLPEIHITGDFIITERKLAVHSADRSVLKISLTLRDRNYLQSYGETISNLYRSVHQLSIRGTETVIDQQYIEEIKALSEEVMQSADIPLFCTASIINGSLFSGFDFDGVYYPLSGTGDVNDMITEYPSDSTEIFQPVPLMDIYPR